MVKNKKFWLLLIFLVFLPIAYADDQYKPYLHKPVVPENPKAKLYGTYQTNLFPGAATYTYPIDVPKGTNNLQPSLSISYNSQAVKQRPSFLGAGWSLTQSYVYRDVNFTPSNTTDDEFKLILNGASYDLVYALSDGFYHTETETFSRIQNITTTSNSYNQYWLVTLKDGTQLRFGYNSDSELISNVGYNYALKWSLDQIEDTHNNKIFYSYNENPYSQDNGTAYLNQIHYNNDQKRRIDFNYENSNRPDRRLVYEQGNKLEESRRLSDIYVFFNDSLIRRYNFEYQSLNNESSLSSLHKIRYIGSDNISILHNATFGYYETTSYYHNSTTYSASIIFSEVAGGTVDLGVRLVDLNNDGYIDQIKGRGLSEVRNASLNNGTDWKENLAFAPPANVYFVHGSGFDAGLRIADLNNDGFPDLIQGWDTVRTAWLNNITGWGSADVLTWAPPTEDFWFVNLDGVDQGTQLIDFNGDGKVDLLKARESSSKKAALNTGNGWKDVSSQWISPLDFVDTGGNDLGVRLVDVNGDGLVDMLKGRDSTKEAWLNNGSGWVSSNVWIPPDVFSSSARVDNGIRFIDLNGDGLTDILQDYKNGSASEREAFINNGNGWSNSTLWNSPDPFTQDGTNVGRRLGDVNGDGFGDIIIAHDNVGNIDKRTVIRNSTIPYLLKNITNEFGGIAYLSYSTSTTFNNTGNDSVSDIGFNVWVVNSVIQNNSMPSDFNVLSNTSYFYLGGKYDYDDSEFRGFNIVNETLSDKSTVSHYFHQSKQLKGKEYRTETYDKNNNIFSATDNNFNFTTKSNGIYAANLLSTASYQYDGNSLNPKITNISFRYDNFSNIISKTQFGDINISGDEKYENYTYAVNTTPWILNKPSWYILFDSSHNRIRETKYFYDNKEYGAVSSKGDLTKKEDWFSTGGGNPTTSYNYDDFGNLYRQTDALGRVITWDYGSKDNTYTYPDRVVNSLGHATDYEYDVGTGNVISYTKNGIKTSYEYDTFGRILKDINPYDTTDFPTKKYTYDFDGIAPEIIKISQRTTANKTIEVYYFYDGFANLVQIKTPNDDNSQQVVKNLFYDGQFRVKEEQNPYFDTSSITLSNKSNTTNTTRYNYDAVGRVISVINPDDTFINTTYNKSTIDDYDANRNRHTYVLDAYDRITEVREYNTDYYILDNQTYNTTYSYNGADELVGIRDAYGNNFNFTYDSLGRKIMLNDPDLGIWAYTYDLAGNLVLQTDNKGNAVKLSYDALNRILQKNTSSEPITFSYDKQYQGTLSNISYGNGTFVYTYDDRLRIIKEEMRLRHQRPFTTGLTYDSMDRVIEKIMPNNNDRDYYYNPQGKLDKIRGYINKTNYNPAGNPLNRTYFNSKITTFDYIPTNLRLNQIKTNTIQQINYTYDNVGNIIRINDSVNNRTYVMTYDNLDRLTNYTVNGYSYIYSIDAIGRILKVIKNNTKTTSLKYNNGVVHFPSKSITQDTGVDVYRTSIHNGTNRTQFIEFYLINEKNASISNVNYTVEFGDGSSTTGNSINLAVKGYQLVTVQKNYSTGGSYSVNITGRANTTATDIETINLIFGTIVNDFNVLLKNATRLVLELDGKNTIGGLSTSWSWNCSNIVNSTVSFDMSSYEGLMVIIEHNFTLNNNGYNITCRVNSSDGNQSKVLSFNFDGIKIESYNSSVLDSDTVLVKFQIKNYYSTLNNINWNITSTGLKYNASGISLTQGQTTSVTQELNFTNAGLKQIKVTIGSGNFIDTYSENIRLYSLGIQQYINFIKNGTTRIFNFIIKNDWTNLSTYWNFTNPALTNTLNLTQNESLIVVIEENFAQGKKDITVGAFNNTFLEDTELDVFKIKHIGINKLETLHENTSRAVTNAFVINNIQKLNVSWKLNNTEQLITSTQNLELNTSEQGIIVIESNFSSSGIYPLYFTINSSTFNDNQTGVAVS